MILKRFSWVYLVLFFPRPIASSSYLRNREERQKITLAREKRVCVLPTCVCVAPGWLPLFFLKKHKTIYFFFFWFCFFWIIETFFGNRLKSVQNWTTSAPRDLSVADGIKTLALTTTHSCRIESTLFLLFFYANRLSRFFLAKKKKKRKVLCLFWPRRRKQMAAYNRHLLNGKKKKKDQKIFLLFLPTIFFLLVVVIADDCETVG